jgi:hypothetical protein
MPKNAGTSRDLIVANDVGKRGRSGLKFVPSLDVGPDRHGSNAAPHAKIFVAWLCPANAVKIS